MVCFFIHPIWVLNCKDVTHTLRTLYTMHGNARLPRHCHGFFSLPIPSDSAEIWRTECGLTLTVTQCLLSTGALRFLLRIVSFVESFTMSTGAPNVPAVAWVSLFRLYLFLIFVQLPIGDHRCQCQRWDRYRLLSMHQPDYLRQISKAEISQTKDSSRDLINSTLNSRSTDSWSALNHTPQRKMLPHGRRVFTCE